MKHLFIILYTIGLITVLPLKAFSEEPDFTNIDNMNLHMIDSDADTGFALYRSGRPGMLFDDSPEKIKSDIKHICDMGITEVMVMSGDADVRETLYKDVCPQMKVVYNNKQTTFKSLNSIFLISFDKWVTSAKKSGKKILFRCRSGMHRTGRLSAYYQMKYMGYTVQKARDVMFDKGTYMYAFPHLYSQVEGLKLYIDNKPCVGQKSISRIQIATYGMEKMMNAIGLNDMDPMCVNINTPKKK